MALDRRTKELAPAGVEIISFAMGDPRERTPDFIRSIARESIPEISSYPTVSGLPELRAACAGWVQRRFGVSLDPATQILPCNGTKEAVAHLAFAAIRTGERDTVVIPSPAYPVYEGAARMAGAQVHVTPLHAEDHWRFRPERVPEKVWERTAVLWLNDPHNPTGSLLDSGARGAIAAHARSHGYWIAADEAYADLWFDRVAGSMLEHGLENVIAFHTLSKRSAMTGYRSGFMAGDPRMIEALRQQRPTLGVATPEFVQRAAIAAWSDDAHAEAMRQVYAAKRDLMLAAFARQGWRVEASEATFFLWMAAPARDDRGFVDELLRRGVTAMPGSLLGPGGEGYVRWALVPTLEQCRAGLERLESMR